MVDGQEFLELYEDHWQALYYYALRLCRPLADDLFQETFLNALRAFHGLRNKRAARAWLVRIMYRCFLRFVRKQQSDKALLAGLKSNACLYRDEGIFAPDEMFTGLTPSTEHYAQLFMRHQGNREQMLQEGLFTSRKAESRDYHRFRSSVKDRVLFVTETHADKVRLILALRKGISSRHIAFKAGERDHADIYDEIIAQAAFPFTCDLTPRSPRKFHELLTTLNRTRSFTLFSVREFGFERMPCEWKPPLIMWSIYLYKTLTGPNAFLLKLSKSKR